MTDKLCFTFEEAGRKLSVSRSMIYRLINAGELCSIHIAGRHLIPADALYTLAKGGSAHG